MQVPSSHVQLMYLVITYYITSSSQEHWLSGGKAHAIICIIKLSELSTVHMLNKYF